MSVAWALADRDTKARIYACHRRAIEVVLAYAEREVFHSRSGTNGVVQEDVEGVVAAAFTHWDSRAGDPQLHDHVVVANRARSVSDGAWRTLDSRGLFKSLVALSELHQGVLSDLLTAELGWGWDGRARRHSDQLRFEVTGVSEALMAEFSQRSAAIEVRKTVLIGEFVAAHGRQPTNVEVLDLRRRATLETRPDKEHRSLADMTGGWRGRAEGYVGDDQRLLGGRTGGPQRPAASARRRPGRWRSWPMLPAWPSSAVAERRATFSRANVLAEVHRQLQGVRFASPDERIAAAERTADLATAQSLLISAPELHHTPERLRRADGTSRFRAKGHEVYTTPTLLEAEARLLDAGREVGGPAVARGTVAAVTDGQPGRPRPQLVASTRPWRSSRSPPRAARSTCWSARRGRASPPPWPGSAPCGKPSTERARCSAWPPLPRRPRSWLPSSVSTPRTRPNGSTSTARKPSGCARSANLRTELRSLPNVSPERRTPVRRRIAAARGRGGPVAARSGPAGDRRRGHPGRDLRPR